MKLPDLDLATIDRVIEMAWEDRTPFQAIEIQFGLKEKEKQPACRRASPPGEHHLFTKQEPKNQQNIWIFY